MPRHASAAPIAKEQKDWGIAGDTKAVRRTITLRMSDNIRFSPRHIEVQAGDTVLEVQAGDTVRLRAENNGKMLHEMVLGTQAELEQHAQMMQKFPGMEHDAPYMAHVRAGQRGDIVWQFNLETAVDRFASLARPHEINA